MHAIGLIGMIALALPVAGTLAAQAGTSPKPQRAHAGPVPVPRAAFIATMDGEFLKMDADKNNIVTKKEIEDYQRAMSAVAVDNRRRSLFALLDADHNGTITPQEFARLQLPPPPINSAPILAQTDLNRDGQVTLVEHRTAKLANFDKMDTDKDGVVSIVEMRAAGLIK